MTNPNLKPEDPEDILPTCLEAFYDHRQVTLSHPGSLFTYESPADPSIRIQLETPDTSAANWSLQASSIWASSRFLADHLQDVVLPHLHRGKDVKYCVLELGAGAGLPGIVLSRLSQDVSVTVSDYPDSLLIETLSRNVLRNTRGNCKTLGYAWGSDPSALLDGTERTGSITGFDPILAADTLWNPELHSVFIETLRRTLRKDKFSRVFLVAGLHTGRYTLQSFLDALPSAGFAVDQLAEKETLGKGEREWDVTRSEGEGDAERRRWVLQMTLKWSEDCHLDEVQVQ